MRFVWAVAAFIVAAVMIGGGIAQRTIFQGPPTQSAQLAPADATAFTVIDGTVLALHPGSQTLDIEGSGPVFAAYGRTADVDSWVADVPHTAVTVDEKGAITSTLVEPKTTPAASAQTPAPTTSPATPATPAVPASRNPAGSDLWLQEFSATGTTSLPLQLPAAMSVIVASDGTAPAPASISVVWPADNATPWAGPLFVLGGLFLIAGVVLYILGIRHARRSRGPRRKGPPPLPPTEPIAVTAAADEDKGVIASSPSRRSLGSRRSLLAVPVVLAASAVALAGCSADAWPQFASSPTPSPTASVIDAGNQQAPVVTEAQAAEILTRISQTVGQADSASNADLAATRLDGAMLAERRTNYSLRADIPDYPPPAAIPTTPLSIVLPQAYSGWPRTVMMVVGDEDDTDPAPTIMMMTQLDPWSPYKLAYSAGIEAATKMPELAPIYVGAKQVPPDSSFLLLPPDQLAPAYADVLNNGANSKYASLFNLDSDEFHQMVAADRQKRLDEFNATGASTGTLSFSSQAGAQGPLALATLESGAIVAVNVDEIDTVKPTSSDAVIKLDNNPTVKALANVDQSSTGFTTTFSDQLFFYVPGQGSNQKIQLLGYSSNILDAKVIQ